MSGIVRNALRFVVGTAKHITNNTTKSLINSQCSRSMWHMGNRLNDTTKNSIKLIKSYNLCNCGCGRFQHTQVEEKLAKYLNGEIAAEKEATREKTIPSKLGKFDVSLDGAEVTLMKKENDETIKIIFNVNHTINSNENEAVDLEHALLSKPNFDVEITRGRQTLGFSLDHVREIIKAILQPNALKPFCVLFFYFLIYQWSGTNALTFYAVQIFNKSGVTINSYLITVVLGVVRLLSTIMACVLCRKCGRRPLTMISSIGCGISMIGFSGYLWYYQYWKLNNIEPSFTWMPVLFIFSYTIACTIGFLVIPWVMIGEVYPVQVRGIMGGLTTFSAHSFVFSVVKSFPFLIDTITMHGTFLMFGCISLFGTIYFYTFLPETKNKTLQEIEDYFSGRNSSLKTGSLKFRKTIIHDDDDKQNQEEEITKT
ncbi:hypothetical protein HCN44_006874 [Aphidius gifuensis]|uniref:Uncharacterized protein n=1 Tax=Aphidius gifuensis TaxID=684658 RepID=A0A834Y2Y5_APHGI|nr:hypothetical protein HCN44_006874 [Aphidius gifuensis]